MSDRKFFLGVDLGGTKIYAVVMNREFKILADAKSSTKTVPDPENIASQIVETANAAVAKAGLKTEDISAVGIAVPSSVDPLTGDCVHAPNLGLKNFSLKKHLSAKLGKDVFLGNDGNCGIVAEHYCGAARDFKNIAAFFVGTGLGGGLIVNDKLIIGTGGIASEFGHMVLKYGGRTCNCGKRGCLEAYCSKTGFVKSIERKLAEGAQSQIAQFISGGNVKSRYLAKFYTEGDPIVKSAIDKGIKMLGAAAASIVACTAPECILLGGGVFESMGAALMPVFKNSFEKNLFGISADKITINRVSLGDPAVAVGAAVMAVRGGDI